MKDRSLYLNGKSVLIDTDPKQIDRINSAFINQSTEEETSAKVNSHIVDIQEILNSKSFNEVQELVLNRLDCSCHKLNINNIHSIASSKSNKALKTNLDLNKEDSFGLLTRDKAQKLNKEQLNFIRRIIETSGLSWKEISRKYFISPSTLSRIKCIPENEFELHSIRKINFTQIDQIKEIKHKIWDYYQQNEVGFVVADVQKDLYYNFGIFIT